MAEQETFEITRTEAEWRTALTPEAFRVLRKHGTERAGSSCVAWSLNWTDRRIGGKCQNRCQDPPSWMR